MKNHGIPPAGLWTTPADLARFAISLQEEFAGRSNPVISESMTRQMLTVQQENRGLPNLGGLGVDLLFVLSPCAFRGQRWLVWVCFAAVTSGLEWTLGGVSVGTIMILPSMILSFLLRIAHPESN